MYIQRKVNQDSLHGKFYSTDHQEKKKVTPTNILALAFTNKFMQIFSNEVEIYYGITINTRIKCLQKKGKNTNFI